MTLNNSNNESIDAAVVVAPYLAAVAVVDKAKLKLQGSIVSTLTKCIPSWSDVEPDSVDVEHLGGAMTNLIFAVHKPEGKDRDVLVRVYGEGTESFFSRVEETRLFQLLSDQKIGVELLGQFANGRAEKLIHGSTYSNKRMKQPEESRIIAKQLRVFHELDIDIDRKPTYISSVRKLLEVARVKCTDDKFKGVVDLKQVTKDVDEMEKILAQVPSPIVLSHNDLQYGNIMKNDAGDAVLIDFEYTSYNPRGYDLGNHFCEWAYDYHKTVNAHLGDFTKYPTAEQQRTFCRAYLAGKNGDEKDVSENEVESLRLEANTYSLASHLFWALWGYIQASQSTIDFDFLAYGKCRYDAYKSRVTLKN
ncbi:putative choline kinase 2 [Phytophthora citrophthora]|uniref:Choline kinase 2 n=1 Tax=Phytophthora citrophthora TaxID=4793 RepID=A0AAD9GX55_9STRA|nr:putative choline kinase 2 [Phytophthora citrophthora]